MKAAIEIATDWAEKFLVEKGGPGSGNFGHAGRPGARGGSGGGAGAMKPAQAYRHARLRLTSSMQAADQGEHREAVGQLNKGIAHLASLPKGSLTTMSAVRSSNRKAMKHLEAGRGKQAASQLRTSLTKMKEGRTRALEIKPIVAEVRPRS